MGERSTGILTTATSIERAVPPVLVLLILLVGFYLKFVKFCNYGVKYYRRVDVPPRIMELRRL